VPEINRERTCPMLIRVFYSDKGRNNRAEDYTVDMVKHDLNEVDIYTWQNATLGEIRDLLKGTIPSSRKRNVKFTFAIVYPDTRSYNPERRSARMQLTRIGQTTSSGGGDADKTLYELNFRPGDFLDVAIQADR